MSYRRYDDDEIVLGAPPSDATPYTGAGAPRIPGPALLGMSDLFVGAVPPPKKPTIIVRPKPGPQKPPPPKGGKPPGKGKPLIKIKPNPTVRQHGQVMKAAAQTVQRSIAAVKTATKAATAHRRPGALKGKPTHLGATADLLTALGVVSPKQLTPKQKSAVAAHQAAAQKSDALARKAGQAALAAQKSAKTLTARYLQQKKIAVALRKPKKGAKIGALIEACYAELGALPDPMNLGFLDNGEPDPLLDQIGDLLGEDLPPMDPGAEADLMEPGLEGLLDPALDPTGQDSGADLPPAPSMDTFLADCQLVGGIPYDGSKGTPDGYCGSYGLLTRATDDPAPGVPQSAGIDNVYHYGFVFGKYHDSGREKGIPFGDNLTAGQWNWVKGRWILGAFREDAAVHKSGGLVQVDLATAAKSHTYANPKGVSYGPLIGNPALPDFVGMRVDGKGQMFWLPQEAPAWLTFPLKQAAALTAQAQQKAAADAAAAEAAAAAKAAADAAELQRQQDAQNALAESQAASEQRIAEQRQATEAKQAELDQQKAEREAAAQERQAALEQERADREAAAQERQMLMEEARMQQQQMQQDAEMRRERQRLQMEAARREQEFLAQHPELQAQAYGYGPEGEGGFPEEGEGSVEEGGDEEGPVIWDGQE